MTNNERYKQLMKKYDMLQSEASDIQQEIINLQYECQHPNMVSDWGSGTCADCGYETIGWYCPKSPNTDRECEYYDPDTDTYDEDCCIYCGEPEERK